MRKTKQNEPKEAGKQNVRKKIPRTTALKKVSIPKHKAEQDSTPVFHRNWWYLGIGALMAAVFLLNSFFIKSAMKEKTSDVPVKQVQAHWFMLHRKSNKEYLYYGVPGDLQQSKLKKTFIVKTGIPGERPTPLPQLVGKEYWILTEELEQFDNPETAPYFLTLNIPAPSTYPFGPSPYTECNGQQCNWILPGAFGLHGVANDPSRLSSENPGSSGCIRHTDQDIMYLFNTLDPKKEEIRYYIEDK